MGASRLGVHPAAVRKSRVRIWRRLVDPEAERGHDELDRVKDGSSLSNKTVLSCGELCSESLSRLLSGESMC
jgi:hypothetical protein